MTAIDLPAAIWHRGDHWAEALDLPGLNLAR